MTALIALAAGCFIAGLMVGSGHGLALAVLVGAYLIACAIVWRKE